MGIREDILADAAAVYLDGSTNLAVDAIGANDLAFSGTGGVDVAWSTIGTRRYMAGKSRASQNILLMNVTNNYAIACWALTTDLTNLNTETTQVYNGNSGIDGYGILLRNGNISHRDSHLIGGVNFGATTSSIASSPRHLIASRNQGSNRIYQNGAASGVNLSVPRTPTALLAVAFDLGAKTFLGEIVYMPRNFTADEIAWLADPLNSLRSSVFPRRRRDQAIYEGSSL